MTGTIQWMLVSLLLVGTLGGCAQQSDGQTGNNEERPPIIDVHLHAHAPEQFLAHRVTAPVECALPTDIPPLDIATGSFDDLAGRYFKERLGECGRLLEPATTEDDLIRRTVNLLERYNITAVTSSSLSNVKRWQAEAPNRIIPGLDPGHPDEVDIEELRRLLAENEVEVLGEIAAQYFGLSPSDPSLDPLFAAAEEFDVPVGIHIGLSAPGCR